MAKNTLQIAIQRLPESEGIEFPSYQSPHAAGMDIAAAISEDVTVKPGEIVKVPTGFAIALPEGYEAQIRPRSGLATKHGLTVVNAPGTIDSDYRGPIIVALINLGQEPVVIERGMRIAQMVVSPVSRVFWGELTELPESDRGSGGFGSTGI